MRHKGVNKEETRQSVIDAVGRGFRKHGYGGIGVDGLAKTAGVTSGAFYSHLGSKAGAFNIAVSVGLDEVIDNLPKLQDEHGVDWVNAFAEYYLSESHRSDLECGCAMATLTSEVARFGDEVRAIYEEKMAAIVELTAQGLAGESHEDRRTRAWSMLCVLIGGINVSRSMNKAKTVKEVAKAIKLAAVQAAGPVSDLAT